MEEWRAVLADSLALYVIGESLNLIVLKSQSQREGCT